MGRGNHLLFFTSLVYLLDDAADGSAIPLSVDKLCGRLEIRISLEIRSVITGDIEIARGQLT